MLCSVYKNMTYTESDHNLHDKIKSLDENDTTNWEKN